MTLAGRRLCLQLAGNYGTGGLFRGHSAAFINRVVNTYNSPLVLTQSVLMFLFALTLNENGWNRNVNLCISSCAALSFGVYLMHEHPLVRDVLWHQIVCLEKYQDEREVIVRLLLFAIMIFFVGCGIEFLRKMAERIILKVVKVRFRVK